ncbi:hypothetical protein HanRHA438_Chr15g0734841 [Helianthus annuus]|nr:hypothetical protein HanIR_Chr15g0786151 [Helianthus annuus]KAJ0847320.1 hypothetical protein HanRHA438_Chr15g0734841 [Helianthus annuus]
MFLNGARVGQNIIRITRIARTHHAFSYHLSPLLHRIIFLFHHHLLLLLLLLLLLQYYLLLLLLLSSLFVSFHIYISILQNVPLDISYYHVRTLTLIFIFVFNPAGLIINERIHPRGSIACYPSGRTLLIITGSLYDDRLRATVDHLQPIYIYIYSRRRYVILLLIMIIYLLARLIIINPCIHVQIPSYLKNLLFCCD